MRRYLLKEGCGSHKEGDRMFTAGQTVPSNQPLDQMFPEKFSLVGGAVAARPVKPVEVEPEEEEEAEEGPETIGIRIDAEQAKEVTKDFPAAKDAGLVVVKEGKLFFVYGDRDAAEPLNQSPLKKPVDVKRFVAAYADEAEED